MLATCLKNLNSNCMYVQENEVQWAIDWIYWPLSLLSINWVIWYMHCCDFFIYIVIIPIWNEMTCWLSGKVLSYDTCGPGFESQDRKCFFSLSNWIFLNGTFIDKHSLLGPLFKHSTMGHLSTLHTGTFIWTLLDGTYFNTPYWNIYLHIPLWDISKHSISVHLQWTLLSRPFMNTPWWDFPISWAPWPLDIPWWDKKAHFFKNLCLKTKKGTLLCNKVGLSSVWYQINQLETRNFLIPNSQSPTKEVPLRILCRLHCYLNGTRSPTMSISSNTLWLNHTI